MAQKQPDSNLKGPTAAWEVAVTKEVMREVVRRRALLGWEQVDLQEACARVGVYMPRGTIAKLESGTRKTISVPELIALAAALNTSPSMLVAPVAKGSQPVQILPGIVEPSDYVHAWLSGIGQAPGAEQPYEARSTQEAMVFADRRALQNLQRHRELYGSLGGKIGDLMYLRRHRRKGGQEWSDQEYADEVSAREATLDKVWTQLVALREQMRAEGFEPPQLSKDLRQRERNDHAAPWGFVLPEDQS